MTDYQSLVKKHIHRIAPEADLDQLDAQDDLGSALDLDSMDYYRMILAISEELGLEIPEEDYARLRTLSAIAEYCRKAESPKTERS